MEFVLNISGNIVVPIGLARMIGKGMVFTCIYVRTVVGVGVYGLQGQWKAENGKYIMEKSGEICRKIHPEGQNNERINQALNPPRET